MERVSCGLILGGTRVTPWLSHGPSPSSRSSCLSPSATIGLRPFRTTENAHSFVIWPLCFAQFRPI